MGYLVAGAMVIACALESCKSSSAAAGEKFASVDAVGQRVEALDSAAWKASKWIAVADAPVVTGRINDNSSSAPGASWFLSTVRNERRVVSAKWMTAGLGVYELYLNGQPVGEEVLRPGFTHPRKTKRSFTYDITRAFRCKAGAENVLAVQVTPGWWADKIATPGGNEGMIGRKCAFRGVLELTYADGSRQLLGTNLKDWQAAIAGPVQQAGIFEGEKYDARVASPIGPSGPTEAFAAPEDDTEFDGEILPSDGAEVFLRKDLALHPVRAYVWQNVEGAREGEYGHVVIAREYKSGEEIVLGKGETLVVDFGQNASAVPAFVFKGSAGTVLTCLPGELLNDGNGARSRGMDGPEGSVHRENLRSHNYHMRLEYTFAGGADYEQYRPHGTFFGYRYASITATDEVTIRSIQSIPITSIAKEMETGSIVTSDAGVNILISNTLWGQRSNYLSVPTDCPQRNERQGWTADTQVFAETGTYFANTDRFFHKWLRDVRDTQNEVGAYPGVAPWGQYGDAGMMRVGWADAGIIVPWTVWKQFADTAIVNEHWESMDRFMNHITATRYDHVTLSGENGNYQWADWLSYEPLESCSGRAFDNGPKPEAVSYWSYLSGCYWLMDAEMMADMAAATGRDAHKYREIATTARSYLRETFLNADGTFKTAILNTMQTPALFALKDHLVEGEVREEVIARLRRNFADHDNCLQTGFLGTSILMQTLTENGMADVAYELLFQHRNPSWLYSIDNGATTIWERWNSYMADRGMGPQGMNSFNHYAYGCVCAWLWKSVAGIEADPAQPGFKHIIMRPIPDRRLGHVEAIYHATAGTIKSSWRYEGDEWKWDFSIPSGSTASVTLPNESKAREYGAGNHSVSLRLQ